MLPDTNIASLPRLFLLWHIAAAQQPQVQSSEQTFDLYYITLGGATERQVRLEKSLVYFHLPFTRHYGLDAKNLPDAIFTHLSRLGYLAFASGLKGTLGCTASHVGVIERWLSSSNNEWLFVLEDDAFLLGYPSLFLERVLKNNIRAPCILACNHRRYVGSDAYAGPQRATEELDSGLRMHVAGGGTDGYFVNRKAAGFILSYFSNWGVDCGYDVFLTALLRLTAQSTSARTRFQKITTRFAETLNSRYDRSQLPKAYLLNFPLTHDLYGLRQGSTR